MRRAASWDRNSVVSGATGLFRFRHQQRSEYKGQVERIVRGRALEFNTEELLVTSDAENVGGS